MITNRSEILRTNSPIHDMPAVSHSWHFDEHRLAWFAGPEQPAVSPDPIASRPAAPESEQIDIPHPPTESLKSDDSEPLDGSTNSTSADSPSHISSSTEQQDIKNRDAAKDNIQTAQENLQFFTDTNDILQRRLQSWAELSVSQLVGYLNDRLLATQAQTRRNMEGELRVIRHLTDDTVDLNNRVIRFIEERGELDKFDPRFEYVTRLLKATITEANTTLTKKDRSFDSMTSIADSADIDLDEQRSEFSPTLDDAPFQIDEEVFLHQFDHGARTLPIADHLVDALRTQKQSFGFLGAPNATLLENVGVDAQKLYTEMNPDQREIFERWLNRRIVQAGLPYAVQFDAGGQLIVNK